MKQPMKAADEPRNIRLKGAFTASEARRIAMQAASQRIFVSDFITRCVLRKAHMRPVVSVCVPALEKVADAANLITLVHARASEQRTFDESVLQILTEALAHLGEAMNGEEDPE